MYYYILQYTLAFSCIQVDVYPAENIISFCWLTRLVLTEKGGAKCDARGGVRCDVRCEVSGDVRGEVKGVVRGAARGGLRGDVGC